jgi:mRNA-degrading endonuclease HigB of HigAB toxin-antitoxin module
MNDKTIDKVINLLYKNKGSAGVTRCGFYNIDEYTFRNALEHYINTGEDKLAIHDELTYLGWNSEWNEEQIKLFDDAINGKIKWNIESIYTNEQLQKLKNIRDTSYLKLLQDKTYKNRRKNQFTKSLKNSIKNRDNNKCRICKKTFNSNNLVVHHNIRVIDGGSNDLSNLITVCIDCHKLIHRSKK